MAAQKMPPTRRRSSPDGSISATTSTNVLAKQLKKSVSATFASNSSSGYPLQEEMKLTGGDHLCLGTALTPAGGVEKKNVSLHGQSFQFTSQEQSISGAIKAMLQPYTRRPQTSLEEINKKVSQIYDIVGRAVAEMLENVTVEQSPYKGAKLPTVLKVAEHPAEVAVKPINEENLPMSQCSLSLPVSPTPSTIDIENQDSVETKSAPPNASSQRPGSSSSKRPDSVKTDDSAPQSASSQRSISPGSSSSKRPGSSSSKRPGSSSSKRPGSSNSKRPDSVKTDDSAPHSASSQRSIQSLGDNSTMMHQKVVDNMTTDLEVICGCELSPLIHNNDLYVPVQTSTAGNDILKSYNLVNGQENNPQEVRRHEHVSYAGCKMLYSKNISLLITSSSTTKLGLYQLDTKALPASWKVISRISAPMLDPRNSIPVPYKDDGVIIATVINQQPTSQIKFHIFSSKAEKNKSVTSHLQSNKYLIQSCVILVNYIYCGLIVPKEGVYIYKFDIASLRKETKEDDSIPPNCIWTIKNPTLQSCFLSVLKGVIFIVSILTNNNKSIMEIKRLLNHPKISSVEDRCEFPCVVKVVAASGIQNPLLIAVMYHNDETGKCYVKRVPLSSV